MTSRPDRRGTRRTRHLATACGIGMLLMMAPDGAWAASCGITGRADVLGSITYNPFSPTGVQATVPIVVTRFSAGGGAKTQTVNFVLTQPRGAPAYQVFYQGANVLYTTGMTGSHPTLGSSAPGEIFYHFGGASAPDRSEPFDLTVTIPPGTDLSSGDPIRFDIVYVCKGTGALDDVLVPTTAAGAVLINVNVVSAVQASYAGEPLDFGDITDIPVAQANTRTVNGAIRVASSGPYAVSLDSQNRYRMTFPGANPADPAASVRYSATFVGQTRSLALPEPIVMECASNGTTGRNLPIRLRLIDGGVDKLPSPEYRDTLTVTVTPLAALGTQPAINCSAL